LITRKAITNTAEELRVSCHNINKWWVIMGEKETQEGRIPCLLHRKRKESKNQL
jgi:hypothetical protein